jgi:hypothetical protein
MLAARCIVALYVLVWFNIVVPGHTRGIVTVPSGGPPAGGPGCCGRGSGDDVGSDHGRDRAPSRERERCCAVCFVASTYTVYADCTPRFEPVARIAVVDLTALAQVASLSLPVPFWPVGPPSLA